MSIHRHVKIPSQLIVIAVYLALIGLIYLAVTVYVPKLISQSEAMVASVLQFYQNPPKVRYEHWFNGIHAVHVASFEFLLYD